MITESTKTNLKKFKGKRDIVIVGKQYEKGCYDVKGELEKAIKTKDVELVLLLLTINGYSASINKKKTVVVIEKVKDKDVEVPIVYEFKENKLEIVTRKERFILRKYISLKDRLLEYIEKTTFRNDKDFLIQVLMFLRKEKI